MRSSPARRCLLFLAMILQAQNVDRSRPPQTPDLPVFKLPPVFETRLANGLEVLLVEDRRFPLVTVRLGFHAGSKYDPAGLYGLSETTAALLTEGTTNRSARQTAEEAAEIGGAVRARSTADALVLEGNALAENLPKLLDLMSDVVRNPNFPEDEVQLRKQNRKQELLAQRSHADFLADEKITEVIFGPHPYAHQDPTLESIDRLDRAVLAGFRDRHLAPNNAVLILIGALPSEKEVLEIAGKFFGSWERKEVPAPPPARFPEPKRSLALIDRPGSVQADIRIGQLAVNRASPDYFPLLVGNTILGGATSSRLFMNIREKQGFAYDAHSSLQPLKDAGSLEVVTQVRNEALEAALGAVLDEMTGISRQNAAEEELVTVKNYLSGVFVIRLETQDGLASQLAAVKLMGLPLEYLEKYTARVRSVAPGQIQAVARKYISPEDAAVVVVGDASAIGRQLEKFGKATVEKAK